MNCCIATLSPSGGAILRCVARAQRAPLPVAQLCLNPICCTASSLHSRRMLFEEFMSIFHACMPCFIFQSAYAQGVRQTSMTVPAKDAKRILFCRPGTILPVSCRPALLAPMSEVKLCNSLLPAGHPAPPHREGALKLCRAGTSCPAARSCSHGRTPRAVQPLSGPLKLVLQFHHIVCNCFVAAGTLCRTARVSCFTCTPVQFQTCIIQRQCLS